MRSFFSCGQTKHTWAHQLMKKRSYQISIISNSVVCKKIHTFHYIRICRLAFCWKFISINHSFCLAMTYLYNSFIILACIKYLTSVGKHNQKHQDGQLSFLHIHNNITATWAEVWGFVTKFYICFKFVPDKDSRTRRMLTECAHFVPRAAVSWSSSPSLFAASSVSNIPLLSVSKKDHETDE